jgi:hypothetical protein
MSTNSALAQISWRDVRRLTRGMSPPERAVWLTTHTTFPAPRRAHPYLGIWHVASLTVLAQNGSLDEEASWHTVDTCKRTCTCTAGQKGQECMHLFIACEFDLFPRNSDRVEAWIERYERETGASALDLPPEGEDFEGYREWSQRRMRRTA